MRKVTVSASKVYDVTIGRGLLADVGKIVRETSGGATVAIITDSVVNPLYGDCVEKSLTAAGYKVLRLVLPSGEHSKCADTLVKIWEFLAENGMIRSDVIVALGGGVVGDISGFAASSYMRGIHYVQVPTTLLAMVDSSVGGKTAINLNAGKNLAGAFNQPEAVICDLDTVMSLDEKVYIDGCAEVIKYGVIRDAELFEQLAIEMPKSVNDLPDNFQILEDVVARCVEIKADVVNADECDTGIRQLLNFGHTIGHAYEAISDFEMSHGYAVALGMSVICKIAVAEGMCEEAVSKRMDEILKAFGLPVDLMAMNEKYDFSPENLAKYIGSDKKHVDNYINLIVPNKIGECVIRKTSDAEINEWIKRL